MHYLKVVTFSLLTCAFFKLPNAPHEDRQRWACSMHPAGMSCADGAASAGNQCQSTAPNRDTTSTATVTFLIFLFLFPSLSPTFSFLKQSLPFRHPAPLGKDSDTSSCSQSLACLLGSILEVKTCVQAVLCKQEDSTPWLLEGMPRVQQW